MKKCEDCKYWSELVAKVDNQSGSVVAMCLNLKSKQHGEYTGGYGKCELKEIGFPIDMEGK